MRGSPDGPARLRARCPRSSWSTWRATAPGRERQACVAPLVRVVPALERRRRAPQHRHAAGPVGAEHGEIARVVAEALFLLVGGVVLLVDDHDAEVAHRREHRRARADRQRHRAGPQRTPRARALALGEARVQHRDRVAEAGPEPADQLRRERDLGHQEQRALALGARLGDGAQIDLGLARAGDAAEQERLRRARAHPPDDRVHRGALIDRGGRGRVGLDRLAEERVGRDLAALQRDQPLGRQAAHRDPRVAHVLGQLVDHHLSARVQQREDRELLGAQPRGTLDAGDRAHREGGAGGDPCAGELVRALEEPGLAERAERLGAERGCRRPQHLADRVEVVVGRLGEERQQLGVEDRLLLEQPRDRLGREARGLGVHPHDDRGELAAVERHRDPRARRDASLERGRERVGEHAPRRNRDRDVGVRRRRPEPEGERVAGRHRRLMRCGGDHGK